MNRQTSKIKENRMTQLLLFSMFGFGIVVTLLSSLSVQPNLTNGYFYLLLFIVMAVLYKPFGIFLLKKLKLLFSAITSLFKITFRKDLQSAKIEELNCIEIVHYLQSLFEKHGYETKILEDSNKIASDLIISKGSKKYIVQTKIKENTVGVKTIQEVLWEVRNLDANGAIVITNQYFTSSARKLAQSKDIKLVDGDELLKILNSVLVVNPQ